MKARIPMAVAFLALTATSFILCLSMLASSRDFAATYWAAFGLLSSHVTGRLAKG